jgi:hypothetical protein
LVVVVVVVAVVTVGRLTTRGCGSGQRPPRGDALEARCRTRGTHQALAEDRGVLSWDWDYQKRLGSASP